MRFFHSNKEVVTAHCPFWASPFNHTILHFLLLLVGAAFIILAQLTYTLLMPAPASEDPAMEIWMLPGHATYRLLGLPVPSRTISLPGPETCPSYPSGLKDLVFSLRLEISKVFLFLPWRFSLHP